MKKLLVVPALLAKAHYDSYTRKDGTFVQAHDDKRAAAKPAVQPHVQKMVSDVAQSSAKPEHKQAAIDAIMSQHAGDQKGGASPKMVLPKKKPAGGAMGPDDVKQHAVAAGAKFRSNVSVFSKPELAHSFANQTQGSKGSAFVMKHPDHQHHVVVGGADAQRMEKNGYQHVRPGQAAEAKPATPKTGSAAPARMVNVGSEKWPLHAKSSEKLGAKHADGSTHHVGGFKPPEYPEGGGSTDGDVTLHHEGKTFSFTGKKGKNMKTGEDSYEYSHSDDQTESRAWVTRSGHLQAD